MQSYLHHFSASCSSIHFPSFQRLQPQSWPGCQAFSLIVRRVLKIYIFHNGSGTLPSQPAGSFSFTCTWSNKGACQHRSHTYSPITNLGVQVYLHLQSITLPWQKRMGAAMLDSGYLKSRKSGSSGQLKSCLLCNLLNLAVLSWPDGGGQLKLLCRQWQWWHGDSDELLRQPLKRCTRLKNVHSYVLFSVISQAQKQICIEITF